jgi:DNA-binding transcriptional LysR family regulator
VPLLPHCMAQRAHLFVHYPNRKHLPMRVRSFVNFMLERFRKNPDLVSDPQLLVASYLRAR